MVLAAASLFADGGDVDIACELLVSHRGQADDSLRDHIDAYIDAVALHAPWLDECGA